jgi:hypothetical protein
VNLYGGADLVGGSYAFNRVGRPDLVARLAGLASRHIGSLGPFYEKFHRAAVDDARATLGETLFEQYATQGAASEWEDFWKGFQQEIEAILSDKPAP